MEGRHQKETEKKCSECGRPIVTVRSRLCERCRKGSISYKKDLIQKRKHVIRQMKYAANHKEYYRALGRKYSKSFQFDFLNTLKDSI
jgi:predicted amidophosphoribosyltransferase